MWKRTLAWLGITVLVLSACGPAATATPQPQATPTKAPTATPTVLAAPTPSGDTPRHGGSIAVRWRKEVVSWEPHKRGFLGSDGSMIYNAVFSPLGQRIPTGPCEFKVGPEAAESWKWVNDTTLEIKLRPNLRFPNKPPVNGRLATAEDVVWSLKRYIQHQARAAYTVAPITDVIAADANTVRVITSKPYPGIVDNVLAAHYGSVILPKETEKADGLYDFAGYLGTGPYAAKEWVPGVKAVLERNPNYYKSPLPYLDEMAWINLPDEATALATVRAGKVNLWVRDLGYPSAKPFVGTDIRVTSCPETGPSYWVMRIDKAPFNDVRVRRALSMAVDRQALLDSVLEGQGLLIGHSVPAHRWLLKYDEYPPEAKHYMEYHPDEAKKLLAEAGYPNGFKTTFHYSRDLAAVFNYEVEALMDMFAKVGVKLELVPMLRGEYQERVSVSADFPGMALSRTMDINPYEYLTEFHSSAGPGTNKAHLNDPVLDRYIDEFQGALDPEQARKLAQRVEVYTMEQVYKIRPPTHNDFRLASSWVRGFNLVESMTAQMSLSWAEGLWSAR